DVGGEVGSASETGSAAGLNAECFDVGRAEDYWWFKQPEASVSGEVEVQGAGGLRVASFTDDAGVADTGIWVAKCEGPSEPAVSSFVGTKLADDRYRSWATPIAWSFQDEGEADVGIVFIVVFFFFEVKTTKTLHGPGSSAIAPETKRAKDLAAASSSSPRNRRCEPPPDSQPRRSQTTNTAQSANPRKSDLNVSIPAPLNLKRSGSDNTNPFVDPKRAQSTKASATKSIAKDNPFFNHEERKWNLPSPTSDTDEDDGEGIVAPSVIPGGEHSDSAYSDDTDTEQRFLEEHDTLMKLVGRGQLRTRDYLNTLPERMESRD
ncbi:MAG: hypothetical protein Q9197_006994, partial [Variospora fuerteventurae]